jgi:glycosyltransferase involved in cell wall biosynthesis
VSAASARILRPLLPEGSRLHQVQNFTEVPRDEPAPVERNEGFVYVGRLSAEKGALLLAECLNRLKLPAVFVGDGELAGAVRARHPQAELTGWLPAAQVREKMRSARALVFPSLWYETQGLVVAEAAAMGVPSIVPDTSAARDWVIDGTTGLWFTGGSADALCAALTRVRAEPSQAVRMGLEAYRRFWAAPPTLDRHLQELERVYSLVLGGVGSRQWAMPHRRAMGETC